VRETERERGETAAADNERREGRRKGERKNERRER